MIDFLKLSIPFKSDFLAFSQVDGEPILKDSLIEIAKKAGIRLKAGSVTFQIDGDYRLSDLQHPYEALPSHFGSLAFKIFNGSDDLNKFPHVEIKASPAKLLQGHNVFGTDSLDVCALAMFEPLIRGLPDLYDMLDIQNTVVDWIDVTYSAHVQSEEVQKQLIHYLQNIEVGQMKKTQYSRQHKTTAEWGTNSRRRILKVYLKGVEVEKRRNEYLQQAKKDKSKEYLNRVVETLSDPRLISFSRKCVRFEARLKRRYLDEMKLPRRLFDLVNYQKDLLKENRNVIEELWRRAFEKLFDVLGASKVNIYNRDEVLKLLRKTYYTVTKNGNFSYAKADRLFAFYNNLVFLGYFEQQRTMPRNSFWRYERDLIEAGISKAHLQNLKGNAEEEKVLMMQFLKIDFNNQFPEWYVPPVMNNANTIKNPFLRMVV